MPLPAIAAAAAPYVISAAFLLWQYLAGRSSAKEARNTLEMQKSAADKQVELASTAQSRQASAAQDALLASHISQRRSEMAMSRQRSQQAASQAALQSFGTQMQIMQALMGQAAGDATANAPGANEPPMPGTSDYAEAVAPPLLPDVAQYAALQGAQASNPLTALRQQGLLSADPVV